MKQIIKYLFNNNTDITFFVVLICLVCPIKAHTENIINLKEAVNEHVYNTNNVKKCRLNYKTTLLQHELFKRSLLPSIQLNIAPISFDHKLKLLQNFSNGEYSNVEDYSNTSNGDLIVSQYIRLTGGTVTFGSSLSHLYEFSKSQSNFSSRPFFVNYNQKLLGGRRSYKFKKMINDKSYEIAARKYCHEIAGEQLVVLNLFMDAYTAKHNVDYYTRTIAIGDTILHHTRLKLSMGKITDFDCNTIELQHLDNLLNLNKSIDAYNIALYQLGKELQISNIQIGSLDSVIFPEKMDAEIVYQLAILNNPTYQDVELQKNEAAYALHLEKINNRFNANIALTYGINQYAHDFIGAYSRPNQQQAVSVTLNIPIFQWGINKRKIQIAKNNYETALIEQEKLIDKFQEQVHECVFNYNRCRATLHIAEKRYMLSIKQYDYATDQFRLGKISTLDFITIENEQRRNKQEYLSILQEMYRSYYKLRQIAMYDFCSKKDLIDLLIY